MSYKKRVNTMLDKDIFLKMEKYVNNIDLKNKVMNLTGFRNDILWQEGIFESIISFEDINLTNKKVLDIGAGAGFPSVPLLIVNNKINLTIIDSQNKRINFLKDVSKELDIKIDLINQRAETFNNSTFDLITARAVAPLFKLIEISHHLGKNGCVFYFIKGKNVENEIKESREIIKALSITDLKIIEKKIDDKIINIVSYTKQKETPKKYPREWSKIKSNLK